jgi:hypothetical protein
MRDLHKDDLAGLMSQHGRSEHFYNSYSGTYSEE